MATVILVEDDEQTRKLHAHYVRACGFDVISLGDASTLIERLKESGADTVLLDLSLPGENGIVACQRIKADPTIQHVRVVMLSAHDSFEAIRQSLAAGAEQYLKKPLTRERTLALLKREPPKRKPVSFFKRALRVVGL